MLYRADHQGGSHSGPLALDSRAQHVGRHPGPLGAFFRRLAKRKNRNIAVVATARKMVTIAVHMLKNKEPYRYALPRPTDEKLAALRVKATGEKRKHGLPKGVKSVSKIGGGKSRTTPALDEVYAREGLPSRRPAHPRRGTHDSRERHRAICCVAGQADGRGQEVIVLVRIAHKADRTQAQLRLDRRDWRSTCRVARKEPGRRRVAISPQCRQARYDNSRRSGHE